MSDSEFNNFLAEVGLHRPSLLASLASPNKAGNYQKYLLSEFKRYKSHPKKEKFFLSPYQRPKSKYDKMHHTQWLRSLKARNLDKRRSDK